jgi:signal transduction histidine kinase
VRNEHRVPFRWLLTGLCLTCVVNSAQAKGPRKAVSQYVRDHWGSDRGFPAGPVYAIAQSSDGYLWVGTEQGLVRFDGLNFRLFQHVKSVPWLIGPVLGLTADGDGNLWIRLQGSRLLRYRNGTFEEMSANFARPEAAITAMSRGRDGEALFSTLVNGTLRYESGRFSSLASAPARPDFLVFSMAEAQDGEIWLGTRDAGLFRLKGGQISPGPPLLRDRKINCILASQGQELWVGTDDGLVRWNGAEFLTAGLATSLRGVQVLAMSRDRESNIWIGTTEGLIRLDSGGVFSADETVDRSNGEVTAIFEDREGNLWVGGSQGLERLREGAFTTYSVGEGLPSNRPGPLYADSEGRIWFAPLEGGLYWMSDGEIHSVQSAGLDKDVVYAITGGKGELWVGRQNGGLTHLRYNGNSFTSETYTEAQGLAQNSVYSGQESPDGTVWAGTLSAGLTRDEAGNFTTYSKASGLASDTVTSITEAADGTMWFGTPNGLNAFSRGRWRTYSSSDDLPQGTVNCLMQDSTGVLWVGTDNGLAFVTSGRVEQPREVPDSLREPILGIEEDRAGWLWIASANQVLRVNRTRLLQLSLGDADVRDYGLADGLRSTEGVKRQRSVVADSLGRIWFSTNGGLSVVDPAEAARSSPPAIVQVQGISADGRALELGPSLRIPAPHRKITVSYAGLTLSVPERVRFRVRLDGFDRDWSEPVASTDATYTNLAPGSYRFRVIASNSDGLWNSSESAVPFEIEPAFWQTWWFRLSCVLALGSAVLVLLRLRTIRLTRRLNARFEERLAERTRIAQELHDTLLQGFLSASMQLHVADDRLPCDSPAKPLVQRVLELMGHVIEESRNVVGGLRSSQNRSLDLEQAFSRMPQEFAKQETLDFRVFAEGATRPLHPGIRDEIYSIGREAVTNAFRHSHASKIEVELEYASDRLRVLVRDNGTGIDPHVLRVGRDGHWGLLGMRERATKIGAKLRVLSSPAGGTEVELSVPSHIAFVSQPSGRMSGRSGRFLPWKRAIEKSPSDRRG